MNNRDILEDQFIKETGRFAFLDPNKINPEYVEWLEKELIKGQSLPIDSVSKCDHRFDRIDEKRIQCIKCEQIQSRM